MTAAALAFRSAQMAADELEVRVNAALNARGGAYDAAAVALHACARPPATWPRHPRPAGAARCERVAGLGDPPPARPPPPLPVPTPALGSATLDRPRPTPPAPPLPVRRSRVAGMGLYTLAPVPAGTAVVEYAGALVRPPLADAREAAAYARTLPRGATYLFALPSAGGVRGTCTTPLVVDATGRANVGRFANHSCEPNLVASIESAPRRAGGRRIMLRAKRKLVAGEEVMFEYQLTPAEGEGATPCRCGAAKCRGWL